SMVPSVHRAIDWNHSSRAFGSVIVLDRFGSGIKAIGFQRLLQRTSNSFSAEGTNADRDSGIQRRGVETLLLGETLSWAIPNAYRSISRNSPCTRQGPQLQQSLRTMRFSVRIRALHRRAIAVFGWKTAEKCGRFTPQVVEVIQKKSPAGNS